MQYSFAVFTVKTVLFKREAVTNIRSLQDTEEVYTNLQCFELFHDLGGRGGYDAHCRRSWVRDGCSNIIDNEV